jgi:hypothetical protein
LGGSTKIRHRATPSATAKHYPSGDLLGPYVSKKIFKSETDFQNEFDRWTFGAALKISKNV